MVTLNNDINISTSLCYSEPIFGWITNTNSSRRYAKAHLKVEFPSTNEHYTLSLLAFIGGTNTIISIETSNSNHNSANKYSVKYSLRDPHDAHTLIFTHVGQRVSGDHISKIHLNIIMTSRLQSS